MRTCVLGLIGLIALVIANGAAAPSVDKDIAAIRQKLNDHHISNGQSLVNQDSDNLHLEHTLRFPTSRPGSDADQGRARFGLDTDLETIDSTDGLFEGFSPVFGGMVESNGRTCATCHRGTVLSFGMPPPPLTDTIPLTDPLFTGIDADAAGDSDAMTYLNQHGLFKSRPNRFNLARPADDPYRRVFFWRKSPQLVNVVFSHGLLVDGRARTMFEVTRGAVFTHTQDSDNRFDDLLSLQDARDIEAFLLSQLSDPALEPLLDPSHPQHNTLANDPFVTVDIETAEQWKGRNIFIRDCFACHNTPNVFSNRWNVIPIGSNPDRDPASPPFGPNTGRYYNIGVAERNRHNLRFTEETPSGFQPIVIPLANKDGSVNHHTVTSDIGLAATTGRSADIGRFKVPQLRNIRNLGPYFHDNSTSSLEEVIDYFNSSDYNQSKDGQHHPIQQAPWEQQWLLEFLKIL